MKSHRASILGFLLLIAMFIALLLAIYIKQQQLGSIVSSKLTWAPPPCGDATHACATYQIIENGQGHQFLDLDTSKDWIVKLPSNRPQRGGIDIDGGHNVIIIGGEIDLTTPCTTDDNVCHGINISRNQNATGEVYIEGVLIKNPDETHSRYTGDGIDVNTDATSNITLQNIRVEGIDGCGYNGNPAHADVFQPYGAKNADINVDHLTGTSDLQGMQIDPDRSTPHSGTYKNVNIIILSNSHPGCMSSAQYGWWLANACKTYPMTLSNDYEQEPNKSLAYNAVWPDTDATFGCPAQYTNGIASWPGLSNIHGSIINGLPPGGDFVPVGVAGINYASPGYQTAPTFTPIPTYMPTVKPTVTSTLSSPYYTRQEKKEGDKRERCHCITLTP